MRVSSKRWSSWWYALHAIDVAAVDYLVKPFDDERFEEAFQRARRLIRLEQVGDLAQQLRTVLERGTDPGSTAPAARPAGFLERVAVETRGQVRVVPVKAIDYITASGAYVVLHAGGERLVVRERLQLLEERLDPARFFRIHRSTIVQLDRIETLLRAGGGDYAARLKTGVELRVSRSRIEELERRLGL